VARDGESKAPRAAWAELLDSSGEAQAQSQLREPRGQGDDLELEKCPIALESIPLKCFEVRFRCGGADTSICTACQAVS
jgi:hypothetical protein